MLWYKAWVDTRWRFLACALLLGALGYLMMDQYSLDAPGWRQTADAFLRSPFPQNRAFAQTYLADLDFRNFGRKLWLDSLFPVLLSLAAVVLGSGGLVSQARGEGGLFSLTLPVSRGRALFVRTAVAWVQLAALALLGAFVVPIAARAYGQSYPLGVALGFAAILLLAQTGIFALTVVLSTLFRNPWSPSIIGLVLALELAAVHVTINDGGGRTSWTLWAYIEQRAPWPGVLVSLALAATFVAAARWVASQRSF